jgi:hypothetical protein
MILEVRNKKPFIHFGFNQQEKTINVGEVVNIWQDTLYVNDKLTSSELLIINNNQFTFEALTAGSFGISVYNNSIKSNTLKIIVL